jgi:protein SCO1
LPVFIFLFLKFFSKNHYDIPRYVPLIDSTKNEPIIEKVINRKSYQPEYDTVFHKVGPFSLVDQTNKIVTEKIVENKIYVADFFFTRCGTICPKMSTQLTRVQDKFENENDVLILSHSVDPTFDSASKLDIYAKKYEAKYGKWYFLTGTKKDIYTMALKQYFVPVSDAAAYDFAIKNPDEAFIHSEKLILVDKNKVIRGFYDGTNAKDVDRLIVEIKILLDNDKK